GRLDANRAAGNNRGSDPLGQSSGGTLDRTGTGMRGRASDVPLDSRETKADSGAGFDLERCIEAAATALLERQQADGHWVFELEADATIPAEYVLMRHFRGEPVDTEIERKIAVYLRRIQGAHGGWPLFHEGAFDMSASV